MSYQPYSDERTSFYGTDIDRVPASSRSLGESGDVRVTSSGDLATVSGPQNVLQSRLTELTTPYGAIGRYVEDVEGVKYVDGNYGNPAYNFLSEPMNELPLDAIAAACEYVMLKDARVADCRVKPDIVPDQGLILLRIEYVLDSGEDGVVELSLNPSVQG